jgi:hypothetical protein
MTALAGVAALSGATAANAAITIGTTGTDPNSTFTITNVDNVGIPETVAFRQNTDAQGSYTSFFDFSNDLSGFYSFLIGTSTLNATVTFGKLLSNGGVTVLQQVNGSGNSISFTTGTLDPGAIYRLSFNSNYPAGGGVTTGNGSFYAAAAVPEPATWGLMLLGFGGMGMVLRRRRRPTLAQIA